MGVRSLTSFELQALIRSKRPNPLDYAPTKVSRDQRVPVAQATIAATVDRSPQGPAEPASGIGIGPNAGRVVEGQPGGDPGETTVSRPDIIAEQRVEGGEPTPDNTWKVADLKAYADEHGIDLKGATTKAAILAAIEAAK